MRWRQVLNAKEDAPLPLAGEKDLAASPWQGTKRSGVQVTTHWGVAPTVSCQKSFVKEMPMANGNVITTHGLTKRYGKSITAVDALDLEVHRGEVFGFLGPTGAGN